MSAGRIATGKTNSASGSAAGAAVSSLPATPPEAPPLEPPVPLGNGAAAETPPNEDGTGISVERRAPPAQATTPSAAARPSLRTDPVALPGSGAWTDGPGGRCRRPARA